MRAVRPTFVLLAIGVVLLALAPLILNTAGAWAIGMIGAVFTIAGLLAAHAN